MQPEYHGNVSILQSVKVFFFFSVNLFMPYLGQVRSSSEKLPRHEFDSVCGDLELLHVDSIWAQPAHLLQSDTIQRDLTSISNLAQLC